MLCANETIRLLVQPVQRPGQLQLSYSNRSKTIAMKKSLISALTAAGLIGVAPLWAQQQETAQGSEINLTLSTIVVRQVQQALNKAGFDAGGTDGNFRKRVREALASFQRSHGLEPTGQLSQRTLAALDITPQGGGQTGCDDQAGGGQSNRRQRGRDQSGGQTDIGQVGVGQIGSGPPGGYQADIGQTSDGQADSGHNPVVRPTVVRPTVARPTVARPMTTRKMMTIGPSDEPTGRANSPDLPQARCKSSRDFR